MDIKKVTVCLSFCLSVFVFYQGHMKTHSGGMTNDLNASVVLQSSEGNYKDTMEASPHASSGKLQEGVENGMEKTSEKLSLTEDSLATAGSADGGQEPENRV